jgi:hypothetical protein
VASRGFFTGCVPEGLEQAVSTPEGEVFVRTAIHSLLEALKTAPGRLNKDVLNLMGFTGAEFTVDVETARLVEVGHAYLALLDGKITTGPSDPSFVPGCEQQRPAEPNAADVSRGRTMRAIWGWATKITDLGVVAEQCPYCERTVPCLLRSVCRIHYVCFLETTGLERDKSCLCTGCHQAFPSEHWRYAAVLPIEEAKNLPPEDLLARTNPGLADRFALKEQVHALGCDARFAVAYEQLELLRPGALRQGLLQQLLGWERLPDVQRALLGEQIGGRSRAWQLARQLAPGFPRHAGCLPLAVAALLVGPALLWVSAVRSWFWGSILVAAGFGAGVLIDQVLFSLWVREWTRKVLIPAAENANVSLDCFLTVVDDVPGSRLGLTEDLWPMKDQLETIRGVLIAEGKLEATAT